MKRKIIVEIDYPEGFDSVWDHDKSGLQTFHDTVINHAMAECVFSLSRTIEECKKRGLVTEEQRHKDQYYQYTMTINKVVNTMKQYGYIDENNVIHHFNNETYKWEIKNPKNKKKKGKS